ncbi:Chk1 protein kinase [Savitreella phatthalungensis]
MRPTALSRRGMSSAHPPMLNGITNDDLVHTLLDSPEFARYEFFEGLHGDTREFVVIRGRERSSGIPIACKISRHALRLERDAFATSKLKALDTHDYIDGIRDVIRIKQVGLTALVIAMTGGHNRFREPHLFPSTPLNEVLGFCVRACECIEFVHRNGMMHGEIGTDSFRWNEVTATMLPFGSGAKSWDNALSSENWRELSKERGIERKLAFLAPEQTGRLSTSPDHRTDIYGLAICFWYVLNGRLPYVGTPMQVLQAALSKKLPTSRGPGVLESILVKAAAKQPAARYKSVAGLRHDLCRVLAGESDFELGEHDVSSVFTLPSATIGREMESLQLVDCVRRFVRGRATTDFDENRSDSGTTRSNSTVSVSMPSNDTPSVICISGPGGVGKSSLIAILAQEARASGYFASAKFDRARARPYSAILKCVRSVLRQLLAENEDSVQELRDQMRAMSSLSQHVQPILDLLPELRNFLGREDQNIAHSTSNSTSSAGSSRDLAPQKMVRHDYSTGVRGMRSGGTKLRFTSLFLDILKVLSHLRPMVLVLDDVHQADSGSLELIASIVSSKASILLCLSMRPELDPSHDLMRLLRDPKVQTTMLHLRPLGLDAITSYVCETLHRPRDFSQPLAAVVEAKSAGNPFFVKEILRRLHDSGIIYFNWTAGRWDYDLSRVNRDLEDTVAEDHYVLRRLQTFAPSTQKFLCWAAFFGRTFEFSMVSKSMRRANARDNGEVESETEHVAALQACIQEGLIHTNKDDHYAFVHDRYLTAAAELASPEARASMHFEVALTLSDAGDDIYFVADHLILADTLVRRHENVDFFRGLMLIAGQKASRSGAQALALRYLRMCYELLPDLPDRWTPKYYPTTLDVSVKYAELCWWENDCDGAQSVLDEIFANATADPLDVATAHVLLCRVQQTLGEHEAARKQMTTYIAKLGYPIDNDPTYEKLDAMFAELREVDVFDNILDKPYITDPTTLTIAMITAEATTAGYWSSPVWFYYLALVMVHLQQRGNYTAAGLGFVYLGIISADRLNALEYAYKCGQVGEKLLIRDADDGTKARGLMCLHAFLTHFGDSLTSCITGHELALQYAITAGDRIYASFSLSHLAALHYWSDSSLDTAKTSLDAALIELTEWSSTTDAFTLIMAIRQCICALRGVTNTRDPARIFTDAKFDSAEHVAFVRKHSAVPQVPLNWWQTYELCPLYHYGHHESAIALGQDMMTTIAFHPCHRHTRQGMLFYALSLVTRVRQGVQTDESLRICSEILASIREFEGPFKDNFACWSTLVAAELADVENAGGAGFQSAARLYSDSLAIATRLGFKHEEALALELQGSFYARHGIPFVASVSIRDAISCYSAWGATGVANAVFERNAELLRSCSRSFGTSVATQTGEDSAGGTSQPLEAQRSASLAPEDFEWFVHSRTRRQSSAMDIEEGPRGSPRPDAGRTAPDAGNRPDLLSLDVIDLTSIIKSSQIISSEVNVETLLKRMLETILENTTAEFGAIVVKEDGQFAIAACGTSEGGYETFKPPRALADDEELLNARIVNYVMHTSETLLLPSTREDGRFNHHSQEQDISILCMPIQHKRSIVGILYIQAGPHTFSRRHVQVLGMLQQQLGISITNALLFKAAQSATLANVAMIESQKQALAQVRESENKYMAVLETMPAIIFTATAQGQVDYLSAFWWKFCGDAAPSWPESKWMTMLPTADAERFSQTLSKAIATEIFESFELSIRSSDGRMKAHDCRATPLRDTSGRVIKWIGAMLDIDDQKAARENAVKAAQMKTAWVSTMSHELRSPFSGFYGMLGLLADTHLDDEQRDIVRTAQQAATSLLQIIDDLLDFSKLEAGKVALESDQVFHVEDLGSDCLELVQPLASKKNLELALYLEENVPVRMAGDSNKIRQVLMNLLGNAVKFTAHGSVILRTSLDTRPCPSPGSAYLRFQVEDTGIGMRPEATKALFKPFSQVDESTTRLYGGTGLGLSICRQIVRLMGGEIEVVTEEGKGSCFYFWIEVRMLDGSVISPHADEVALNLANVRSALSGVNVLVYSSFQHTRAALSACLPDTVELLTATEAVVRRLLQPDAPQIQLLVFDGHADDVAQLASILENPRLSRLQVIWFYTPRAALTHPTTLMDSFRQVPATQLPIPRTAGSDSAVIAPQAAVPRTPAQLDNALVQTFSDRLTRLSKPIRRARLALAFLKTLSAINPAVRPPQGIASAPATAGNSGVHVRARRQTNVTNHSPSSFGTAFTSLELEILRSKRILVAEDNPVQQKLLLKQLSKFGLEADLGHNGLEALRHYEDHPPGYYALFFCDSHMPLLSGADTMRRIRAIEAEGSKASPKIPIITLTADVVAENRELCLKAGAEKYLTKPMTMASLVSTLRQYVLR